MRLWSSGTTGKLQILDPCVELFFCQRKYLFIIITVKVKSLKIKNFGSKFTFYFNNIINYCFLFFQWWKTLQTIIIMSYPCGYRVPEVDLAIFDENLFCSSCGFVSRLVVQTGLCGHLYCEKCLQGKVLRWAFESYLS